MTHASEARGKPHTSRGQANRWARALLCVLTATALAGCGSGLSLPDISALATGTSGGDGPATGNTLITHPVDDLDLEAMAQPGSEWLTDGAEHGNGPSTVSPPPAPAPDRTLHVAFLCLDTAGRAVAASYTWSAGGEIGGVPYYGQSGTLQCDTGPDTAETANCQLGGGACVGRTVQTFEARSPLTVMPQIKVPRGASWVLFAWLAPLSLQPGAGLSADGTGLRRFTGYGLSFTYPRGWYSQAPAQVDPTIATTLEFESTAPLRAACPVTTDSTGTSGGYPCGSAPVAGLPPKGVLVDWSTPEQATGGGVPELGRPRTIAGHPGWLFSGPAASNDLAVGEAADNLTGTGNTQQDGISCRGLKASWVVSAGIDTGGGGGYQMLACIRGPDTGPAVKDVLAMLNSLRLGRNPALQSHAGQLGAVAEQPVLEPGIAGGGVCRAGFLMVEVAACRLCVRIGTDGQPGLSHRRE